MLASRLFAPRHLIPAAIIMAFICAVFAPQVFARITVNTIDPVATIADDGSLLTVTGPLQCDLVQFVEMRVTVTQRTTGAVAEGRLHFLGTTDIQQWSVQAAVRGNIDFEPGPATAVALATSKVHGQADDAHQWLVDIELVAE